MQDYRILFLLLLFSLILSGCTITFSDSDKLTLEDVVPESEWYSLDPTDSTEYERWEFDSLNTTVTIYALNSPCGEGKKDEKGGYDINDRKLLYSRSVFGDSKLITYKAVKVSKDTLLFDKQNDETNKSFYSDCGDLSGK